LERLGSSTFYLRRRHKKKKKKNRLLGCKCRRRYYETDNTGANVHGEPITDHFFLKFVTLYGGIPYVVFDYLICLVLHLE